MGSSLIIIGDEFGVPPPKSSLVKGGFFRGQIKTKTTRWHDHFR